MKTEREDCGFGSLAALVLARKGVRILIRRSEVQRVHFYNKQTSELQDRLVRAVLRCAARDTSIIVPFNPARGQLRDHDDRLRCPGESGMVSQARGAPLAASETMARQWRGVVDGDHHAVHSTTLLWPALRLIFWSTPIARASLTGIQPLFAKHSPPPLLPVFLCCPRCVSTVCFALPVRSLAALPASLRRWTSSWSSRSTHRLPARCSTSS